MNENSTMTTPVRRRPGIAVSDTRILQVLAEARCLDLLLHAPLPVYVPLCCVLVGTCKFFPEKSDATAKHIAAFFDAHAEMYVDEQTDRQSVARIRIVPEDASKFMEGYAERIRAIQDELENGLADDYPFPDENARKLLQNKIDGLKDKIRWGDGYSGEYMMEVIAEHKNLTGPFYVLFPMQSFWHTERETLYQGRAKYRYEDAIDNDFFPAPLEAFIGVLLQQGNLPAALSNRLRAHFQTLPQLPHQNKEKRGA